jgi:urea-proton symporter
MYGAAGSVQVLLFTLLALAIKKKAPHAHTVVEIVRVRFGTGGHAVYLFFAMATNILVTSMILLGGSGIVSSLTGMHIVAANFLLPIGVFVYTLFGGIKATFLSDWVHTVIIYVCLIMCMFIIYGTSSEFGSPDAVYDMLDAVSKVFPSAGASGSYVTFDNQTAFLTGVIVMFGGFATVFGDPSYAQKAIAADSVSVVAGYLTGGLCWFIIPCALGTCGGLIARALLLTPSFPTYPEPMTLLEVGQGLPMPYALMTVMGKNGAAVALLIVFMAVTSSTSAELIACSSVLTYDIYRPYINPNATGKELVRFSHIGVVSFGVAMGALSTIFNYIGKDEPPAGLDPE